MCTDWTNRIHSIALYTNIHSWGYFPLIYYQIRRWWGARSHMRKHCKKYWYMFVPTIYGQNITENFLRNLSNCQKWEPEIANNSNRTYIKKTEVTSLTRSKRHGFLVAQILPGSLAAPQTQTWKVRSSLRSGKNKTAAASLKLQDYGYFYYKTGKNCSSVDGECLFGQDKILRMSEEL
jgi:hypothetical protein